MSLTSVPAVDEIISTNRINYGDEWVAFDQAYGRILAQPIVADRDFPPFDRVTMDGIAIDYQHYSAGQRSFCIETMQTAGEAQKTLQNPENCIEVMTGAMMPQGTDTVIRYEDLDIKDNTATILTDPKQAQNVHFRGQDRLQDSVIVPAYARLGAAQMAIAASVGATQLCVRKLPTVTMITSGDELVGVTETPLPHQIRTSNIHCIAALLKTYGIVPQFVHISDNQAITESAIGDALATSDVVMLCGGVSKGKKDFIPAALQTLGITKLLHGVSQQPGKPFWFGRFNQKLIFALPGNPVSTLVCARRYFIPWLRQSLGLVAFDNMYAALDQDYVYKSPLTYFLQVKLYQDGAMLMATPMTGNGSGDFTNLVDTQAFMELPLTTNEFKKGQVLPIWKF